MTPSQGLCCMCIIKNRLIRLLFFCRLFGQKNQNGCCLASVLPGQLFALKVAIWCPDRKLLKTGLSLQDRKYFWMSWTLRGCGIKNYLPPCQGSSAWKNNFCPTRALDGYQKYKKCPARVLAGNLLGITDSKFETKISLQKN